MFSAQVQRWVELDAKGGRRLNQIKSVLEKRSGSDVTIFRGNVLDLELDKATNRLTVAVTIAPEIEPEVVDYDEFKRFMLRERP